MAYDPDNRQVPLYDIGMGTAAGGHQDFFSQYGGTPEPAAQTGGQNDPNERNAQGLTYQEWLLTPEGQQMRPQVIGGDQQAAWRNAGQNKLPGGLTAPGGGAGASPYNDYGTGQDLSDAALDKFILESARGRQLPASGDDSLAYWREVLRTPDVYSDRQTRVGPNEYLAQRIAGGPGTDSADVSRAGSHGIVKGGMGQWGAPPGGGNTNLGMFGSLAQGWQGNFQSPSVDQMREMPGYQFALSEGVKALDRTGAARGTALSGGHKKDVLNYAIGLADQTGQQKYQNALGEYMNAYSIFRNNQNDLFDRYDRLAERGTRSAGAATS